MPLQTPGVSVPGTVAPPHTSLMGGFTLLKKELPKGRSRIRRQDQPHSVMITTQDGSQFMVDAGSVNGIPEKYRAEVKQQIETIQRMAQLFAK